MVVTFVIDVFVAFIVPVVNPVVTIKLDSVSFVAEIFVNVLNPVALIVPVVNPDVTIKVASVSFVAVIFVKDDNPLAFIDPVVIDVETIFEVVTLVAKTDPVVRLVVIITVPFTSSVAFGDIVLIPTFPDPNILILSVLAVERRIFAPVFAAIKLIPAEF